MKKYSQDLEDYVIKTDGKEIVSEEVNREITKKLSDCNGLVIIDNPIVQQTAKMLDDDYMEIKNLMSGGIRV